MTPAQQQTESLFYYDGRAAFSSRHNFDLLLGSGKI